MDPGYWMLFWIAGIPAFWILVRLRVPWRLSSLVIPGGVLVGGLLSGMLGFLPVLAEWALLVWLAVSMYGMMLVIGRFHKPWAEEQGWRW